MNMILVAFSAAVALTATGCFTVKTESEIKPIHITMDVNLKVDKELDKAFADETAAKPKGGFAVVRDLLSRGVAGFGPDAMLVARDSATDDDRLAVAEENARRLRRFGEVAKTSGTSVAAAQARRLAQLKEKAAAGTWFRAADGSWSQKR